MKELKETIEWKNETEGTITVKTKQSIEDEGKVVGTSKTEQIVRTNIEALEQGMKVYEDRIEKNQNDLDNIKKQLKVLGAIPKETIGLRRLSKQLRDLAVIEKAKDLKDKMPSFEEEIKNDKKFLSKRKELLATRPTEDKMEEEEVEKKEEEAEEPKEEEKKEEPAEEEEKKEE